MKLKANYVHYIVMVPLIDSMPWVFFPEVGVGVGGKGGNGNFQHQVGEWVGEVWGSFHPLNPFSPVQIETKLP